jgi:hypothetical protein
VVRIRLRVDALAVAARKARLTATAAVLTGGACGARVVAGAAVLGLDHGVVTSAVARGLSLHAAR